VVGEDGTTRAFETARADARLVFHRGDDLGAKLTTLTRVVGHTFDEQQSQAKLSVEWDGSASGLVRAQRRRRDDNFSRELLDREHATVEQFRYQLRGSRQTG
jgi:hypothetical protein